MINKIIEIEGIGRFNNYHAVSDTFNENLPKVVAIYADNGSGKSTLTHILKSLSTNPGVSLNFRKSFSGEKKDIKVSICYDNHYHTYKRGVWDLPPQNIAVFDTTYVEDNIYVMTPDNNNSVGKVYELVLGRNCISLFQQREALINQRMRCKNNRHAIRNKKKVATNAIEIEKLNSKLDAEIKKSEEINTKIRKIDIDLDKMANEFGENFIEKVNNYLSAFSPNLKMTKLYKKANKFIYNLEIEGIDIRNSEDTISLKRTLSEGEKNSIAISFFLANLSLTEDWSKTIVVFDDPINSMDHKRRHTTKINLVRIAKKSRQFFLLSHDIDFVAEFSDYFNSNEIINLKIMNNGSTAYLTRHNIKQDTLKGVFKDLMVLSDYVCNGNKSKYEPRQIIRCIRPVLETILKFKYYGIIGQDKWLGDILSMIRNATESEPLYLQKSNYDEIDELNDYTSSYHHGDSFNEDIPINDGELKNYCKRTLSLLQNI